MIMDSQTFNNRDPADYWTQNKKMSELMRSEGQEIFQSWVRLTKKRDYKQFCSVDRLTYSPDNN